MREPDAVDYGVRKGIIAVYLDADGVERVRLTEQGWAELEASLRRRGEPIPWIDGPGYRLNHHPDGKASIICKTCGMPSTNPNDIANRYCGHCRIFHLGPDR